MPPVPRHPVEQMAPVPLLLARVRRELSAAFVPDRPIRVSRAPETLDVLGGGSDYAGGLACSAALDRAAAVALQERDDREVQVFSFNLLDDHVPFTLRISLDTLANSTAEELSRGFREPGRGWAAGVVGCLFELHRRGLVDLSDPGRRGFHLALYSDAPLRVGGSSAPQVLATLLNLRDHFGLTHLDVVAMAELCHAAESQIAGLLGGVVEPFTGLDAQPAVLARVLCQPHQPQPPLALPEGVRVVGIAHLLQTRPGDRPHEQTRCAAFMGHRILLEKMRRIGRAAGRTLERDPMGGYLANLTAADYEKFFRSHLPETIKGGEFLLRYGGTIDPQSKVDPDEVYPVRRATDHHVFEAERTRAFAKLLEAATTVPANERETFFRDAGRLMYESQDSLTANRLTLPSAGRIVERARASSSPSIYGARVAADGHGGTIALLTATGPASDAAIAELLAAIGKQTGIAAEAIPANGTGAWHTGTAVV